MRPARRSSAALGALVVLVVPLAACALSTFNGDDYTSTCTFAGRSDQPCGQCIATNCQAPVDACCANEACRATPDDGVFGVSSVYGDPGALKRLDTCAGGGSCQDLEYDPRAKDIAACIQRSCQGVCDLWQRSTFKPEESSCEVKPGTTYSSPSCECTIPATTEGAPRKPNSVKCTRKTVPFAVCCASKDWPAPASTCRCTSVACTTAGDQCSCRVQTSPTEGVNACGRGTCCISAYDGTCGCGRSCGESDIVVDQCTPTSVVCGTNRRTVESCSAE
ncbi:MAG: hypothetical protein KF795_19025 [Labilithrix sp.]|nr:hypothetical protein [Labilithrix sp.]